MSRSNRFAMLLITLLVNYFGLSINYTAAQDRSAPATKTAEIVAAAKALIACLTPEQQQSLSFKFDDEEQRRRWSNLPTGIVQRGGLKMGDLSDEQKTAVLNMVKATLSPKGFQQVIDNMNGDEQLKTGRGRLTFGKEEYYVSLLGTPDDRQPWMWQFGGHHLGINATIAGPAVTLAPSLTGGQPIDYKLDGKAVRQLAEEEDLAFELASSLTDDQRQQAVVSPTAGDMLYGPGKDHVQPKAEGIAVQRLDARQRELLLKLIEQRVGLLNEVQAQPQMDAVTRNLDQTHFAWYGGTKPGDVASFRIVGPTVMMEYAPQRMGGDANNHIHAMFRDPTNDYGIQWRKQK